MPSKPTRLKKATVLEINTMRAPGRHSVGEGLILVVGVSGSRSWIARIRDAGGCRRDLGLGRYPEVSLDEARTRAAEIRRQVRDGIDPVAQRRRDAERIPSFRDAAQRAYAERRLGWRNTKHQDQWISSLETHAFSRMGDMRVDEVDARAIIQALSPIWLRLPETARRVRQRILAVLNWAHGQGYRPVEAPARAVTAGLPRQSKKSGRFAAMPYEQVPQFYAALVAAPSVGRLALQFTILTAARSGEVRGAKWSEIDLEAKIWTVPADRMKAGEEHGVPLVDGALEVLAFMQDRRSSEIIFPGLRGQPLSDATLSKILRDQGLRFTVHGFRSSFRDWAAESMTMPGEVAEAALAHVVSNKVEAAYRRTKFLLQRRTLMAAWDEFVRAPSAGNCANA